MHPKAVREAQTLQAVNELLLFVFCILFTIVPEVGVLFVFSLLSSDAHKSFQALSLINLLPFILLLLLLDFDSIHLLHFCFHFLFDA